MASEEAELRWFITDNVRLRRGLSISQSFLITPIVTKSCARWGVRQVMPAGVLLLSISFVGASFATETWQLMLAQGICFGWGMGILFVGTIGLLPQWFQKKNGLANALAASGSGFGGLGGAFWAVIAPILTDIVGLQVLPTALSIVWLVLVIPSTFSEAIALEIVDSRGGSYLGVIMCTGAMYLGAAICSLAVYLIRKRRGIDCALMA
ncbi:hypothetical protein CDV31_011401 [Fusarium ambrosium]|uniref:Major facilitator superfamily (MFS) profile domain-containing protein n=1 Tax=Fusarium ambrosium TaxID=131363 RepID=A0A428TGY6_9HYPO|nr:hypothetical protein CDV31_011401 [Fusarium ambrosium]